MSELPESWESCSLERLLVALESGSRPRGGVRGIKDGIPSIGGEHLTYGGAFDFSNIKYVPTTFAENMRQGHIEVNDTLIVKDGATTGKVAFVSEDFPYANAVVNEHVFVCRPRKYIEPRFLFRYLTSREGQSRVLDNFQGSAQGGINRSFASNTEIPVAPLNEQRRIVAKLEELLNHVDTAQERLATIPRILSRFRQSVLAAGFSGRLTTDWRREHPSEFASSLIGKLRRGRPPKLQDFSIRDDLDLLDIPETWAWANLRFLLSPHEAFSYGVVQPGNDDPKGVFLIRAGDISEGRVNVGALRRISNEVHEEYRRSKLVGGELLVTVVGAGIGETAIAPAECAGFNIARAVAKLPVREIEVRYVHLWLLTDRAVGWMKNDSREVARPTLNLEQLQTLPVPVAPLEEQQEIVRRVESLFKTADVLEARYVKAKAHIDKLTQSILAKAFRGELVSQDEKDEPATVLLQRIKDELVMKQSPKVTSITAGKVIRGTRRHSKGIFYRRAALDCYVMETLINDPHLGRTKMEKISHLLEHHCGIDLEREPIRDAAGPNDYLSRLKVESLARKQNWYSTRSQDVGAKIDYVPGTQISKSRMTAVNVLGDRKLEVDKLLSILHPLDTKRIEVVATLYAAWNDFLLAGKIPTDDEIIHDVRTNWHPAKQLIPIEWWVKTLTWMRKKQLIPTGTGKAVTYKPTGNQIPKPKKRVLVAKPQKRGRR